MVLTGSQGLIRIESEHTVIVEDGQGRRAESFQDLPQSKWHAAWDQTFNSFPEWLDSGDEPMFGLANVIQTAELNLAAYESAIRGDHVDLPLADGADE